MCQKKQNSVLDVTLLYRTKPVLYLQQKIFHWKFLGLFWEIGEQMSMHAADTLRDNFEIMNPEHRYIVLLKAIKKLSKI